MNVYIDCKIYGPYTRKDGRKHICVLFSDGSRTTVSYPKYLMEKHLNRYLNDDETVDHIDRDFTNDEISNLRVVGRKEHASDDAKRRKSSDGICIWCKSSISFTEINKRLKNKRKSGPFCSRKCSGQYGASILHGGKKVGREYPITEYYYNIKKV
jgi:hypothetical protein